MTEEDVAQVVASFQAAGLGERSWLAALDDLAGVTGSKGGELIGLGDRAAVPFNWMTGVAPEAPAEFVAAGGGDPRVNSRVRIGMAAPELAVLDESAFTSAEDAVRHPEYGEWLRRHDLGFICLSPLLRQDSLLVGLALVRGVSQGNVTAEQRRAFELIAPHVRAAVRTQMAVDSRALGLASDLLDALSAALFICDPQGRVLSLSPAAETIVLSGGPLRVTRGVLAAAREAETALLRAAVAQAAASCRSIRPPSRPVVVRDGDGQRPVLVEICAAPGEYALRNGSAALVIVRNPGPDEARLAEAARALFRLTPAEAHVAAKLAAGLGPQAIAEAAGVAVGTVRTHVRRIFEKSGVRTQVELVALLARL